MKVKYYIKYADDFIVLSKDKDYLWELMPKITDFLEEELKLKLHPDKLFIKTLSSGVDFLGWVNFPNHRVLRTSTKRRAIKALRENENVNSLISYAGLLKYGNQYKLREGFNIKIAGINDKIKLESRYD
jgi:RNA-directed DNA polymerase